MMILKEIMDYMFGSHLKYVSLGMDGFEGEGGSALIANYFPVSNIPHPLPVSLGYP